VPQHAAVRGGEGSLRRAAGPRLAPGGAGDAAHPRAPASRAGADRRSGARAADCRAVLEVAGGRSRWAMPPRPPRLVLTKKTDVIWRASGEKEIVYADFSASQPVRGDGQRDPIPVHARATRARLRL